MRSAGFFILIVTGLLGIVLLPDAIHTDEKITRETDLSPAGRAAIDKGLAYLASRQGEEGAWENKIGYKLNYDYWGTGDGNHVGVTALAGMAFLANGHLPTRGKYARNVRKALDFVLACVDPNNGFITYKQTRMYSHAFAALFLAEIYGMTPRADLKAKLRLIVDLLVHCQNKQGGWRYLPFADDADISLTVSQLQF
ncbi:MAG: prenyltransferase/squalene oxidase repeat-containing protein, partial [Planctomycetota bacterium]